MEQPDFFEYFATCEAYKSFMDYHKENPHIYDLFKKYTFDLIRSDRKHYGAKGVIERIRWHSALSAEGMFKINNNYAPGYARLFHIDNPEHEGFFRTRKRSSDINKNITN